MKTGLSWVGIFSATAILIASALWGRAASAQAVITFDNLLDGQSVAAQYASLCATFNGTAIGGEVISSGSITPESPSNVLINSSLDNEFTGGPLTVSFTQPQQNVSLYGGYVLFGAGPASLSGTLTAFDQAGNPLPASDGQVTDTLPVFGGSVVNNQFAVSSSQGNIWSVTLSFGEFNYTAIDNLQFNGCSTTNPGIEPPTVTGLTVNGQTAGPILDSGAPLTVSASVSGQDLAGTVTISLTYLTAPPGQALQTLTTTVPLTNGQVNAQVFPNLPVGTYRVTVTAANTAGETAAATMSFFYAITAFINSELQGDLEYAIQLDNCQIDVFADTGAWGVPNGSPGTTASIHNIPEPLFQEWSQVRTAANSSKTAPSWYILGVDGTLGCPTDNATPNFPFYPGFNFNPQAIEYLIQDFERGRIYGFLIGPDSGTAHYVPTGFVNAIDAESTYLDPNSNLPTTVGRGLSLTDPFGINEVGMPLSDPTFDLANTEPVFLFQRFLPPEFCMEPLFLLETVDAFNPQYPSQADCLSHGGTPNTLEIRAPSIGALETLYVERVGGALMDYQSAVGTQPQLGAGVPAVWEQYACTGFPNFNCPVTKFHVKTVSPVNSVPIYTTSNQISNDDGYCGILPQSLWGNTEFVVGTTAGATTEWSAIPGKGASSTEPSPADYVGITAEGWTISSRPAGNDFPPTHQNMNYSTGSDFIIGISCLIDCDIGKELSAQEDGAWSDWDMYIRPLALSGMTDPNSRYTFFSGGTPSNGGTPPFWNLLGSQGDPATDGESNSIPMGEIEVEFEDAWQHRLVALPGFHPPVAGHLAILNGRWMIDCGHPPVHSEIHPPSMVIDVGITTPPIDPTTKKPMVTTDAAVTRAQVWFNQLYTGSAVTTQIWPLPRPEPDAVLSTYFLTYLEPKQPQNNAIPAGGSVTFPFTPNPFVSPNTNSTVTATLGETGVVLTASGPSGSHVVRDTGQVLNPVDNAANGSGTVGDYMGAWYIGWNSPTENPCIFDSCL